MKKGFTLIELLAVIVILAIIALIATPIILGIINDAREESNERSVELYASAVRNAIASYQLTHPKAPTSFSELDIQHDGDVECSTQELYEDGSFYITDCTVNGDEVEYTYGEKQVNQVYKPQYYYFGYDWSGTVGETAAPSNPSSVPPTGEIRYLGYDVDANNIVSAAYACFKREGSDKEYCLKGYDTEAFATNTDIIKDAFADVVDTDACSFGDDYSSCTIDDFYAQASTNGGADAYGDSATCSAYNTGDFACYIS